MKTMRPFRDIPIKQKLIVMIMSVTAAALLLSGLGILITDTVIFRQNMKSDIATFSRLSPTIPLLPWTSTIRMRRPRPFPH